MHPNMNAFNATKVYPVKRRFAPNILNPNTMANAAPKEAPLDTPSVYGDARGLRKRFCITQPLSPRANAVIKHNNNLGRRTLDKMYIFPV